MKKLILLLAAAVFMPLTVSAEDDRGMARVVTFKENVSTCLAPVQIRTIDGRNRNLPSLGFKIEPGWHTMHGSAKLDLRRCPVRDEHKRSSQEVHIPPLEWLFEAGKVYYVGLDYSSPSRENWRLVVWDVKDDPTVETDG